MDNPPNKRVINFPRKGASILPIYYNWLLDSQPNILFSLYFILAYERSCKENKI